MVPAPVAVGRVLGRLAMRTFRYEQAKFEYELVLKLDAEFPSIRLSLSDALVKLNKVEEARVHLREEIGRLRSKPAAERQVDDLDMLGRLLLASSLPADAAWVLEWAVNEQPDDVELIRQLALARFQAGDRIGGAAASRPLRASTGPLHPARAAFASSVVGSASAATRTNAPRSLRRRAAT